jgi:hypothetical protein
MKTFGFHHGIDVQGMYLKHVYNGIGSWTQRLYESKEVVGMALKIGFFCNFLAVYVL